MIDFLIRPVLFHSASLLDVIIEFACVAGLFDMICLLLRTWTEIPVVTAIHFGFSGKPDRWGSKTILMSLPMGAIVFFVMFTVLAWLPSGFHSPWPVTQANWIGGLVEIMKLEVIVIFAVLLRKMVNVALGKAQGLGGLFLVIVVLVTVATPFAYLALTGVTPK